MEKILVISDTHGNADLLKKVMRKEKYVDRVIHLGDLIGQDEVVEKITKAPLEAVAGNCDYGSDWPAETMTEIGNHLAFLCHGHFYDVDYDTDYLEKAAQDMGADMAFFGHTHIPYYHKTEEGITICNPGSLARPRTMDRKKTYVILEVDDATGEVTFFLRNI